MGHGLGSVVHTSNGLVLALLAHDKWDKSKYIVASVISYIP